MSFGTRSTKIYVGNLPGDIRSNEVEGVFKKYGRIKDIDVKNRADSSFAFVEFESSRDAEDAIHGRNNYRYEGHTLKVELSKGVGSERGGRRGSGGYRGSYNGRIEDRNNSTGAGGGGRPRLFGTKSKSTEFRLRITGLPQSASWQDLKDHMKSAGDVSYADVFRDGTGVCDYLNEDDMKYALKTLDESELKTYRGDVGRIRLEKESRAGRRSRSRSRSESPKRQRRAQNYPSKRNERDTSSSSRSSSN